MTTRRNFIRSIIGAALLPGLPALPTGANAAPLPASDALLDAPAAPAGLRWGEAWRNAMLDAIEPAIRNPYLVFTVDGERTYFPTKIEQASGGRLRIGTIVTDRPVRLGPAWEVVDDAGVWHIRGTLDDLGIYDSLLPAGVPIEIFMTCAG